MKNLLILCVLLVGCGKTGANGPTGPAGTSCSVIKVPPSTQFSSGSSQLTCTDGTKLTIAEDPEPTDDGDDTAVCYTHKNHDG